MTHSNPIIPQATRSLVVLLEDDSSIVKNFRELFEELKLDIDLKVCRNHEEYLSVTSSNWHLIKCLIMDLNTRDENMDISVINLTIEQIKQVYETKRIPIFVHSGNLNRFEELNEKGTLIKKLKSDESALEITNSIKLMLESNFLSVFSTQGTLDIKIMAEIHSAFINQFKSNEIENIIKSIQKATPKEEFQKRTQEVFERIALRAIYQNVIINSDDDDNIKVNSIEHYYRRTDLSKKAFYTGDIFTHNDTKERFFIATPRCNISNKTFEQILICQITPITSQKLNEFLNPKVDKGVVKGEKTLSNHITDNNIGDKLRFLPLTPQFEGGFVDYVKCLTISPEELCNKHNYTISLVDDLTNDVVRKLATYLLRGGISDTAYREALFYFEELKEQEPKSNNTQS